MTDRNQWFSRFVALKNVKTVVICSILNLTIHDSISTHDLLPTTFFTTKNIEAQASVKCDEIIRQDKEQADSKFLSTDPQHIRLVVFERKWR